MFESIAGRKYPVTSLLQRILWIGFCLAGTFLFEASSAASAKLGIFYPTTLQAKDIEKAFEKDPINKNLKVVAFGNFEDFQTSVDAEAMDFAIVPSVYLKYYSQFQPIFQMTAAGKTTFKYLLVSLDPSWNKDRIGQGTAGIVNTIGRDKTKALVDELMANKTFKRIKQVSKVADLFPLLALGNANYALFSPQDLEKVLKDFTSKPVHVLETIEVAYPVVCIKKGKSSPLASQLGKLRPETLKVFGMDGMEATKIQ